MIAAGLLIALRLIAASTVAPPQSAAAMSEKKFDVASVKPCEGSAPEAGRRTAAGPNASPGYLYLSCLTLRQLTLMAHAGPGSRLLNRKWEEQFVDGFPPFVKGGPAWAYADRYTVEAKAEGVKDRDVLTGPMLRALLADRFQLKHHRESDERNILSLTVLPGGLKIQPIAPGSCYEIDPNNLPTTPVTQPTCGLTTGNGWGSTELNGVILGDTPRDSDRFTDVLWRYLRRPVIDRTGLNGRYTFRLEFTPDDTTPGVQGRCGGSPECIQGLARNGASDDRPTSFRSSDSLFKALEKLGLKLEQIRAAYEFIVIDSAERPRPDAPSPVVGLRKEAGR